ncbi:sensor histidine kinase [Polynucleobacter sp. AP-Nickl1-40-C4]|uniref:sensor histidine kinase n=1 Tax=Polynucleobacter sp. AP-Nickl1-40-C4 TaxID=3108275 RepID=UPI002B23B0F0|nr:ATP-binding protein [Polynucleobacter sp. AP-Nickl1-40-C4]MEA9569108.1 ATP-binding protein [Polynucleobacter sp. AP-Nickl1-40-C4]
MSSLALVFLYRSWGEKPFNKIQTLLLWLIPLGVAILYEPLRVTPDTFLQRVALITITQEILVVWQLWELIKFYKKDRPSIVSWIIFLTIFTLIGNVFRTYRILTGDGPTNIFLYTEDAFALGLRWITYASNIMTFVALGMFYFQKQLTKENQIANALKSTKEENEKITELLKEKERLIYGLMKANKTAATGALSASIAHELNQPLGASNLNIQFLKMKLERGALNPGVGKEILDSLEEDNKRAATIVRSLRSIFTEGESNAQEVRLSDLIAKVLDIVKPELKNKNIQIQLRVDDDLVIRVNSSEIEQVILNLLNNAAQALANSGTLQRRIAIEALKTDNSVQLSISDNGAGVPEDFKSQLFELLSTTKQTGMGLGLWLCKHIVTRYSGSIHYEDAVGGGAKFVIELPLN